MHNNMEMINTMQTLECKADLMAALSTGQDPATLRERLAILPVGRHRIKSVGACPHVFAASFLYLCTADGRLWRIDDRNSGCVADAVSLAYMGIKPFPCDGEYMGDGTLVVAANGAKTAEDVFQMYHAEPTA
jgi:hypothetical protein